MTTTVVKGLTSNLWATVEVEVSKIILHSLFEMRDLKASDVSDLADNIKQIGRLVNPLLLRPSKKKKGFYELISGHRRFKSIKLLKWKRVTARIGELTDHEAFLLALSENIGRSDPTALEEARAYKRARDKFKIPVTEIGEKVGKDKSTISNRIRLLDMDKRFLKYLEKGDILPGHCEHGVMRLKHQADINELHDDLKRQIGYGRSPTVSRIKEWTNDILKKRKDIERLAKILQEPKVKAKKCPTCKTRGPDPTELNSWNTNIKKGTVKCDGDECHPWNIYTGRVYKPRDTGSSSGSGSGTRHPKGENVTKMGATGLKSEFTTMDWFNLIAKTIKKGKNVQMIFIEEDYGEGVIIRIKVPKSKMPIPSVYIESKTYAKGPHKSKMNIGGKRSQGHNYGQTVRDRETLLALEKTLGKKTPAEIMRVRVERLVIEHKALQKGKELIVTSGKWLGGWTIVSVHRDYTAIADKGDGKKTFLEEQDLRALVKASIKKKTPKKKAPATKKKGPSLKGDIAARKKAKKSTPKSTPKKKAPKKKKTPPKKKTPKKKAKSKKRKR